MISAGGVHAFWGRVHDLGGGTWIFGGGDIQKNSPSGGVRGRVHEKQAGLFPPPTPKKRRGLYPPPTLVQYIVPSPSSGRDLEL